MLTTHQIRWINENLDIAERLIELGVDVPPNGKVFCPFHYNVNTPAAKVYGGRLYCYSEQKHYTTFDVLKKIGYTDDEIRNMVPKEHWYSGDEVVAEPLKIPVIDDKMREEYKGRVFDFLAMLDFAWEHPEKFGCLQI